MSSSKPWTAILRKRNSKQIPKIPWGLNSLPRNFPSGYASDGITAPRVLGGTLTAWCSAEATTVCRPGRMVAASSVVELSPEHRPSADRSPLPLLRDSLLVSLLPLLLPDTQRSETSINESMNQS